MKRLLRRLLCVIGMHKYKGIYGCMVGECVHCGKQVVNR